MKSRLLAWPQLAWLLAGCVALGVPYVSAAEPTITASDGAIVQLVRQADFWRQKGRTDLATKSLDRVLASDAKQPDALYRKGLFAAQDGAPGEARQWLDKLRSAAPGDARVAELEAALRRGQIPDSQISDARRLARTGKADAAVHAYQRAFRGNTPPPDLAREYYLTLAGTSNGWEPAHKGLTALVAAHPNDVQDRLALAQVLTYRESTRREGIETLAPMAATHADADAAWRQALLWLNVRKADAPLYTAYAKAHPDDDEVMGHFRDKTVVTKTAAKVATTTIAFKQLQAGDTRAAEARFREALRRNPQDDDALGGMGILRLRAGDFTSARDYLRRASAANPAKKQRWAEALASAEFFTRLAEIDTRRDAGDWAAVERDARALASRGGPNRSLAEARLADALYHQDRFVEAEATYRGVLKQKPDSSAAAVGLFQSLIAQGRTGEANAMLDQLPDSDRDKLAATLGQARAERLRNIGREQAAAGRLDLAADNLSSALAANPSDPWVRLDLAHVLVRQGKNPDALRLMDGLAASPNASGDQLYAAAMFAAEGERWDQAARLLDRIPAAKRSADMKSLAQRVEVQHRLQLAKAAAAAGRSGDAATQLRALADRSRDPGVRGQAAAMLLDLGQPKQALAIAREDLDLGARGSPAAYQGQLSVLVKTGHDQEAIALLRQLDRQDLSAADRTALNALSAQFAANRADQLRLAGRLADAWDVLSQGLAQSPGDTQLLLALGRLYSSGQMPDKALRVYNDLLAKDPDNAEVLRAAAAAAVDANDTRAASDLMNRAIQTQPQDAELYFLAGRLAKERGDRRTAERMFEAARSLNRQESGMEGLPTGPAGGDAPATRGALGPNPFQRNAVSDTGYGSGAAAAGFVGDRVVYPEQRNTDISEGTYLPVADVTTLETPPQLYTRGQVPRTAPAQTKDNTPRYAAADAPPLQGSGYAAATIPDAGYAIGADVGAPRGMPPAAGDSLEQRIDRELAGLHTDTAVELQTGIGLRQRNGEKGLSRLAEISAPVTLSLPVGQGKLALTAEPVFIGAGRPMGDSNVRFGSNPLIADAPVQADNQSDAGVALSVGYTGRVFSADIGSTPLGFQESNIVGGVAFNPQITDHSRLGVHLERRAVTDSVLSYAGTRDPRTGESWGGVTKSGGGVSYSYDDGDSGMYAEAMAHRFAGTDVEDNTGVQANIGGYIRPYSHEDGELKVGVNLTYLGFDKNLRYFTRGHGGYFSPQQYASLSFPVEWSGKQGNFSYKLGGALGYQYYTEDDTPVFPGDAGLQGALPRSLSKDLPGPPVRGVRGRGNTPPSPGTPGAGGEALPIVYPGRTKSGVGVSLAASGEYALTRDTSVGGRVAVDSFGDYTESSLMVYLRHMFGGSK